MQIFSNPSISAQPLLTYELAHIATEIIDLACLSHPELEPLYRMQRTIGCRVNELFEPWRWQLYQENFVIIQPQKGNNQRLLSLREMQIESVADFEILKHDMEHYSKRQYERAFAHGVRQIGLYQVFEDGFAHPSTHMLRHLKIKEMQDRGNTLEEIQTYIGEKCVDNLYYYLNSQFYI